MAAVALRAPDGTLSNPDSLVDEWRTWILQAQDDRKRFEGTWHLNLAYAAGDPFWGWNRITRTLQRPPGFDDSEHYHADVITEYRQAALGELTQDDDRPQLLLAQQGVSNEEIQKQINQAVGHGWEYEWGADEAIQEKNRRLVDLGTVAIRARFDPTAGPLRTDPDGNPLQIPIGPDGPITNGEKARAHVADMTARGETAKLRELHEGRTVWEVAGPFNLLVPPGINHEKDFPRFVWVRPRPLDQVIAEYGQVAEGLTEDTDIGSVDGLTTTSQGGNPHSANADGTSGAAGRVRGHVWVYTCYDRPCRKYPNGRVVILAGNSMRLLDVQDRLPKKAPDGSYRTGVTFFHWLRRNDAFWSRSLIDGLKDPQRMINRRKRQNIQIIDHGMPKVFITEKGRPKTKPAGIPLELVVLGNEAEQPSFFQGMGPGEWMYRDIAELREDLAHASTLSDLRLGQNPENVDTYSQLARLDEVEAAKRRDILKGQRLGVARLIEDSVYDIKTYWPEQKQILIAGDGERLQSATFEKSTIPDFYVVRVATGAAKPRSQAAELTKIGDIFQAAVNARVADQRWVKWYADSIEAGQPLPVPDMPASEQTDKAQLENEQMAAGAQLDVAYYDNLNIHLPVHRAAQDRAQMAGDMDTFVRIERHVKQHEAYAAENQARLAAAQGAADAQQPPEDGAAGATASPKPTPPSQPPTPAQ